MSNILTIPASGSIYFDGGSAGSSTVPDLTGSAVSLSYDGNAGLNITSYNALSADRFSVDGSNGRLFSISDSLTGTIFSVNDAAGLPIIEVESDTVDTVTIGTYGTNALVVKDDKVGIGTATPNEKLTVSGNISASGSITAATVDIPIITNDVIMNGTENTMPNQTLDGGDASVLTYGLAKGYDPLAYSTLTTPSASVGYLPFGFGRIDGTYAHNWGTNNPPTYFLPFIIRGEFTKCSFNHNAGTHPTAVMEVAVYNAGSDGKPTTLIDQQTVSLSSTGRKTVTFTSPISVDGLFYAALRPSIGKTEWDSTGGSGTLQVRGYAYGSNPFLSQILGSIDPSTFDLYDGTMIFRYLSYTHPFPSDLTGDGSVTLVQIADSPLYTVLLHS